jgi:hypothetical protein
VGLVRFWLRWKTRPLLPTPNLVALRTSGITDDAVFERLSTLSGLTYLGLRDSAIAASGLKKLLKMEKLEVLEIDCCTIADSALVSLALSPKISSLLLYNSNVTDADLLHLTKLKLKELRLLHLQVKKLHALVPQCRLVSDFGTFGPPDRSNLRLQPLHADLLGYSLRCSTSNRIRPYLHDQVATHTVEEILFRYRHLLSGHWNRNHAR